MAGGIADLALRTCPIRDRRDADSQLQKPSRVKLHRAQCRFEGVITVPDVHHVTARGLRVCAAGGCGTGKLPEKASVFLVHLVEGVDGLRGLGLVVLAVLRTDDSRHLGGGRRGRSPRHDVVVGGGCGEATCGLV